MQDQLKGLRSSAESCDDMGSSTNNQYGSSEDQEPRGLQRRETAKRNIVESEDLTSLNSGNAAGVEVAGNMPLFAKLGLPGSKSVS